MPLIALVGGMGRGKTVLLTKLLHAYYQCDKKIYTNIESLKLPIYYIDSYEALHEINEGVVGISEFWVWADSRNSGQTENKFVSNIVLQSRKDRCDIIYDLQDFGQVDIRIRNVTDMIIHAKDKSPLIRNNGDTYQVFYFDIYEKTILGDYKFLNSGKLELSDYFYLYDTYERHKIPEKNGKAIFKNRKLPKVFTEAQSKKNGKRTIQPQEDNGLGLNDFSFEDTVGLEDFTI